LQVIECGGQGQDKVRPSDGLLGITAGHGIPGVRRVIAEVFQSSLAIGQVPSMPPIQETPTRLPAGNSAVAPSTISPTI
jgi:hypothetical protein